MSHVSIPAPGGTYTAYIANLTQSGVNDPSAIEFVNTLGSAITWTRLVAGQYRGRAASAIFGTGERVFALAPNIDGNTGVAVSCGGTDIFVYTFNIQSGVWADNNLFNTTIEVRVYP